MTAKKRQEIIAHALALLDAGMLFGVLVAKLMSEYNLTRAEARDLAATALMEQWRRAEASDK
jgi:hypothetical protein